MSQSKISAILDDFENDQGKKYQSNIFTKAFLRPFEVVLKTWENDDKPEKIGDLPFGLKQVIREEISDTNYFMGDFFPLFSSNLPNCQGLFEKVCENNCDNLISLMKLDQEKEKHDLEIAICISMYSEERSMLKKTLDGVKENIRLFAQQGISPDRIGVFVIIDGIEHVHDSMKRLYEDLEEENNMIFDGKRVQKRLMENDQDQIQDKKKEKEELNEFGELVFSEEQLYDLHERSFIRRKTEYLQVKNGLEEILSLQKQKMVNFDKLNGRLQNYFIQQAKEHHKSLYANDTEENKKLSNKFIIQTYVANNEIYNNLMKKALSRAGQESMKYISGRDQMAIVHPFRVQIEIEDYEWDRYQAQNNLEESLDQLANETERLRQEKRKCMNLFMVTKYKNGGKLSSHNWFFNGFLRELKTKYAILLDVGLAPEKEALVKIYKSMEQNEKVGGVCGYIALKRQPLQDEQRKDWITSFFHMFFDIQKAQQMEYHYNHLVEKPFEAIFKFVHVLPGAFSGYRMQALKPLENEDQALLKQYFKSLNTKLIVPENLTSITAWQFLWKIILPDFLFQCFYQRKKQSEQQKLYNENVYLAEDRSLCMGIHINGYELQYVPDAYSWADPMKTLPDLLGQRKRWINGSYFAFEQVKAIYEDNQKKKSKILAFQIGLLSFINIITSISPALFIYTAFLAIYGLAINMTTNETIQLIVITVPVLLFVLFFFALVFYSLFFNHKNQHLISCIFPMSTFLGIISLFLYVILFLDLFIFLFQEKGHYLFGDFLNLQTDAITLRQVLLGLLCSIFLMYIIPIILYTVLFKKCINLYQIFVCLFSFLFFLPTYLIILNTFAIARIDDISWGTKGLNVETAIEDKRKNQRKIIKMIYLAKYLFYNIVVVLILMACTGISLDGNKPQQGRYKDFTIVFAIIVTFVIFVTILIKFVLGTSYMIKYKACNKNQRENHLYNKIESHFWDKLNQIKKSIILEMRENLIKRINEVKLQQLRIESLRYLPSIKKKKESRFKKSRIWKITHPKKIKYEQVKIPIDMIPEQPNKEKQQDISQLDKIKNKLPDNLLQNSNPGQFNIIQSNIRQSDRQLNKIREKLPGSLGFTSTVEEKEQTNQNVNSEIGMEKIKKRLPSTINLMSSIDEKEEHIQNIDSVFDFDGNGNKSNRPLYKHKIIEQQDEND